MTLELARPPHQPELIDRGASEPVASEQQASESRREIARDVAISENVTGADLLEQGPRLGCPHPTGEQV